MLAPGPLHEIVALLPLRQSNLDRDPHPTMTSVVLSLDWFTGNLEEIPHIEL